MFQERIREFYDALTPGYRKLADFIVDHTLDAAFLTATELARRVKVDPATVVRFSQEIGYAGYRELSREIKQFVRDQITTTYHAAEGAEPEAEMVRAVLANTQQQIDRFQATEVPMLAEAIKLLKQAPRIWLTAEGSQYFVAQHWAHTFTHSLNSPATAFHPNIAETAAAVEQMQAGEVLLAINIALPAVDIGYAVRMAREKGVHTIAVVNSGTSLPAREAEVVVKVPFKSPVTLVSLNTGMLVLSTIFEVLAGSAPEKTMQTFVDYHDNVSQMIELRSESKPYEIPSSDSAS